MVAELWLYPDNTRDPRAVDQGGAERGDAGRVRTPAYLHKQGVDLDGEQHTKTKTTLEYFAGRLTGEASAASARASPRGLPRLLTISDTTVTR